MPRGGKRAGSGRKKATPGEKRIPMIISVSPETKAKAMAISKERGIPIGRLFDNLIDKM